MEIAGKIAERAQKGRRGLRPSAIASACVCVHVCVCVCLCVRQWFAPRVHPFLPTCWQAISLLSNSRLVYIRAQSRDRCVGPCNILLTRAHTYTKTHTFARDSFGSLVPNLRPSCTDFSCRQCPRCCSHCLLLCDCRMPLCVP